MCRYLWEGMRPRKRGICGSKHPLSDMHGPRLPHLHLTHIDLTSKIKCVTNATASHTDSPASMVTIYRRGELAHRLTTVQELGTYFRLPGFHVPSSDWDPVARRRSETKRDEPLTQYQWAMTQAHNILRHTSPTRLAKDLIRVHKFLSTAQANYRELETFMDTKTLKVMHKECQEILWSGLRGPRADTHASNVSEQFSDMVSFLKQPNNAMFVLTNRTSQVHVVYTASENLLRVVQFTRGPRSTTRHGPIQQFQHLITALRRESGAIKLDIKPSPTVDDVVTALIKGLPQSAEIHQWSRTLVSPSGRKTQHATGPVVYKMITSSQSGGKAVSVMC